MLLIHRIIIIPQPSMEMSHMKYLQNMAREFILMEMMIILKLILMMHLITVIYRLVFGLISQLSLILSHIHWLILD